MPLTPHPLAPGFAVTGQIDVAMVAQAAAQGFKSLINNRPDGEGGPEQPSSADLATAAQAAGLHYVYLPVVSRAVTEEQVQAMRNALRMAPQPVLAFCRTGARSSHLFTRAQSEADPNAQPQ